MYGYNEKKTEAEQKRKKILMDIMESDTYKPLKLKEFKILLGLEQDEVADLESVLDTLITEGKIVLTGKGKYMVNQDKNYSVGTYISHQKGFGFVEIEGRDEDVFIPATATKDAFHGDTVSINILHEKSEGRREEGEIVQVLKRGIDTLIGTFQKNKNFGFVVPDHKKLTKDIFIKNGMTNGAVNGNKVVVKILNWGKGGKNPEGIVTSIIGHINDPETEMKAILLAYGIPMTFSDELMDEVKDIPTQLTEERLQEEKQREDWRHVMTVTIDGQDAKDLDDGISLKKLENGYELAVHIADVTHYVKEGSLLDEEALKRGTSVYLVDRVIPMLPHRLSNGICSLNAGEDRLALSCVMELDGQGKVRKHRVVETIIQVDERMNYEDVKRILVDQDEALIQRYEKQMEMFGTMEALQGILQQRRRQRGSIEFDFPESKFALDDKGRIIDIYPYERSIATKIIEEFMLLANETIAEEFHWQEIPFLYRSHEEPDPEKIRHLTEFIRNYGYKLKGNAQEPHPKEIQKLLLEIDGGEQEMIIQRLALRSMKQAKYTTTSDGHFGLATDYYTHFTSPIRRYPDLQIHRIIKDVINGRLDNQRYEHYEEIMDKVAMETSRLERRAEEVEREISKYKKAEYMEGKVGQMFQGVISGLTSWGIYVELPNTIEGLIPMQRLTDDYYNYDEKYMTLIGEHTGRVFRLGEPVKVEVLSVDKRMRTIDFGILYEDIDV